MYGFSQEAMWLVGQLTDINFLKSLLMEHFPTSEVKEPNLTPLVGLLDNIYKWANLCRVGSKQTNEKRLQPTFVALFAMSRPR